MNGDYRDVLRVAAGGCVIFAVLFYVQSCQASIGESVARITTRFAGGSNVYSGVVIAADSGRGVCLTCRHGLQDPSGPPRSHEVHCVGQPQAFPAAVLAISQNTDVALLEFRYPTKSHVTAASWGSRARPGTPVTQRGYPGGAWRQTVRRGQVVADSLEDPNIDLVSFPVASGDSGSPIFAAGQVVGVVWGSLRRAHFTHIDAVRPLIEKSCRGFT